MPLANFIKVREVSSEDQIHLAENLIKNQHDKKWRTKNIGEKSAYVILEMSGSYQITGIDIGNEHSAFVEVMVGKSTCAPGDFKEILITSSFMTPTESKSSNNIHRVRCFNRDALVSTVAEDKWSLIKILCTQPFNKHVAYGLSFIKIHINDVVNNSSITKINGGSDMSLNKVTQRGQFKFRADSPDSESENYSTLFNRWKKSKDNENEETTAALIRKASKISATSKSYCGHDNPKPGTTFLPAREDGNILDRNREKLMFGDETECMSNKNQENLEHLSKQITADKKRRRAELEMEISNKKKRKSLSCSPKCVVSFPAKSPSSQLLPENLSDMNDTSLETLNKQQKNNKPLENPKRINSKIFKPFNQLLKDVVLVISGIQNPDRGVLRNKAIALGAKYKADWDSTCTHLICAFKNTPKYNQVKGKGKIVTRSWIEKCFHSKKYLPWRRYALDSIELSKPESDEEVYDLSNSPDLEITPPLNTPRKISEERSSTLALYGIGDKSDSDNLESYPNNRSSEGDTDDEIRRIEQNIETPNIKTTSTSSLDIYDASTEEEDYVTEKNLHTYVNK